MRWSPRLRRRWHPHATSCTDWRLMTRYVFSTADTIRYRYPTHVNDLVLDRTEAATTEVFIVVLEPGEAPPLHQHDDAEQIFYIMEGSGTLTIGDPAQQFEREARRRGAHPAARAAFHSVCRFNHAALSERGCLRRRKARCRTHLGQPRADAVRSFRLGLQSGKTPELTRSKTKRRKEAPTARSFC